MSDPLYHWKKRLILAVILYREILVWEERRVWFGSAVSQDLALDRGTFDNRYGFVCYGIVGMLGGLGGMEVELVICACVVGLLADRYIRLGDGVTE